MILKLYVFWRREVGVSRKHYWKPLVYQRMIYASCSMDFLKNYARAFARGGPVRDRTGISGL